MNSDRKLGQYAEVATAAATQRLWKKRRATLSWHSRCLNAKRDSVTLSAGPAAKRAKRKLNVSFRQKLANILKNFTHHFRR